MVICCYRITGKKNSDEPVDKGEVQPKPPTLTSCPSHHEKPGEVSGKSGQRNIVTIRMWLMIHFRPEDHKLRIHLSLNFESSKFSL
jgi:hypothetical protein